MISVRPVLIIRESFEDRRAVVHETITLLPWCYIILELH